MVGAVFLLTRPETPVLLGFWLIVWCALLIYHWRSIRATSRVRLLKSTLIAVMPLLIALGVTSGWKKVHKRCYGIEALSCTEAPGEVALLNALYSIPPDELIRYAPVTRQSLAHACEVSSTLNQYREKLLDVGQSNYRHAKRFLDLEGQVGAWLNWHLQSCFRGSRNQANQEMLRAAAEISQAQKDGRLGYRRAMFPIDPLWKSWLPEIPNKVLSAVKFSFFPNLKSLTDKEIVNRRRCTAIQQGNFDNGLLRRRGTRLDNCLRIYGRSPVGSSRFKRIRITDGQQHVLGLARISKASKGGSEFNFVSEMSEPIEADTIFAEFLPSAPENSSDRNAIRLDGHQVAIGRKRKSERWFVTGVATQNPGSRQLAWQAVNADYFYTGLCVAVGLAFFIGATKRRSRRMLNQLAGLIVISTGLIGLRMLMYSMIEVWLKWGLNRYTEPNHLVAIFLLILSGFFLGYRAAYARPVSPPATASCRDQFNVATVVLICSTQAPAVCTLLETRRVSKEKQESNYSSLTRRVTSCMEKRCLSNFKALNSSARIETISRSYFSLSFKILKKKLDKHVWNPIVMNNIETIEYRIVIRGSSLPKSLSFH